MAIRPSPVLAAAVSAGLTLLTCACAPDGPGVAGAAGGSSAPRTTATTESATGEVECPERATGIEVPRAVTDVFPLPEGTTVVRVETRSGARVVVDAVIPRDQRTVLSELQRALPAAGLTMTNGEVEEGDAESDFSGRGVIGRWGIRAMQGCASPSTQLELVVRPA